MNLDQIKAMAHSPLHNYAIPGLTSWIIGANPDPARGCVRLFECSRTHYEPIIPHSHRFDFQCLVLAGEVANITWEETEDPNAGDLFVISKLRYDGAPGQYPEPEYQLIKRFTPRMREHSEGEWYYMKHNEIHSIYFKRGTAVLFFEGPKAATHTKILEPMVDEVHIRTFKVEDWMFRRG